MSYIIRHEASGTALEDLIDLINCHLPEPLNPSKYLFLKNFPTSYNLLHIIVQNVFLYSILKEDKI